jgi:hypothetical protein
MDHLWDERVQVREGAGDLHQETSGATIGQNATIAWPHASSRGASQRCGSNSSSSEQHLLGNPRALQPREGHRRWLARLLQAALERSARA